MKVCVLRILLHDYSVEFGCVKLCEIVYVCVRFEKQLQEEENALQQQRRRLYKEVADEKERLAQQAARSGSEVI